MTAADLGMAAGNQSRCWACGEFAPGGVCMRDHGRLDLVRATANGWISPAWNSLAARQNLANRLKGGLYR